MTNQKELCLLLRYTTPITKGSIQVPFVTIFYKVWEEEMREGEKEERRKKMAEVNFLYYIVWGWFLTSLFVLHSLYDFVL